MIDIHVLTHSGTRQDWLDQCLASLEHEPCTVHVVEGVEGSVGAGRAKGYALGEHEFVGFVDSDDFVLPGVMDACLEAFASGAESVCTLERAEFEGKPFFRAPQAGHHLFACRRDVIAPMLDHIATMPWLADMLVARHLKPTQIDFVGYVWRLHADQAHHHTNRAEFEREQARFPWLCS